MSAMSESFCAELPIGALSLRRALHQTFAQVLQSRGAPRCARARCHRWARSIPLHQPGATMKKQFIAAAALAFVAASSFAQTPSTDPTATPRIDKREVR